MTLTEFLLARIAEDEAVARAVPPLREVRPMGGAGQMEKMVHSRLTYAGEDGYPRTVNDAEAVAHYSRHDPARVLAECEAKRRIVEAHPSWLTLSNFAAVYADHPDYDPEWRP